VYDIPKKLTSYFSVGYAAEPFFGVRGFSMKHYGTTCSHYQDRENQSVFKDKALTIITPISGGHRKG
jgi:hypothetical protein